MLQDFSLRSLAELLVLPPANLFLLFLAGWGVARWRRRLGVGMQCLAVLLLYLLSVPMIARAMLRTLEPAAPLDSAVIAASGAGAIVVLAGDMERTPEYGGATIGALSLERLRYAARLARLTGLPLLVTGGILDNGERPIAELMRDALEEDFGIKARWVENRAQTTADNARFSAAILRREGIATVVLVTHAFHMPRATLAFANSGMTVVAAPTIFSPSETESNSPLPSAKALHASFFAVHEWVGLAWYRLNYRARGTF
jgi:uncharacterized SAM-binding protein YcdF (DUF218 family)